MGLLSSSSKSSSSSSTLNQDARAIAEKTAISKPIGNITFGKKSGSNNVISAGNDSVILTNKSTLIYTDYLSDDTLNFFQKIVDFSKNTVQSGLDLVDRSLAANADLSKKNLESIDELSKRVTSSAEQTSQKTILILAAIAAIGGIIYGLKK